VQTANGSGWLHRGLTRLNRVPLLGPIVVTLVAAVLRLWNLGDPARLVFDEHYYVKDAYALSRLGYPATWRVGSDIQFAYGNVNDYQLKGEFVAHPPLGKWIISFGMDALGPADPVGWRISDAVVGILAVVLLMAIAYRLFRSRTLATIAGLLMAIDGNAIVMSRVGMLDNFVMFFALLGFGAILLDRQWSADRLAVWIARSEQDNGSPPKLRASWGPTLWWRPWLFLAGLAFGLTSAVKWSGIYFLAAFAVYSLVVDALARRRAGIGHWASGTLLKQAPATFLLTVPIAAAAYLASWTGWLVTKGGYDRSYADQSGHALTGVFSWIPHSLQSFWHLEQVTYAYDTGFHKAFPYQANAITWLFMVRPTNMVEQFAGAGQPGCAPGSNCTAVITDIANPLIWWASGAAMFFLIYRMIFRREWRVGLILMGVLAGYGPWLLYTQRTVFQYYTIAFEPYLILALVFTIGLILGKRGDPVRRRRRGRIVVGTFLVAAVLMSAFFLPLWTCILEPDWFVQLHYWWPGWS
jgi:dolichyl-phosphate-mannose-protein mannosyltransferase